MKRIAVFVSALMLIWQAGVSARTYYVATNGPHLTPFTNWSMAASNDIQAAINLATNGESVLVSNGTYALVSQITVISGVTVQAYTNNGAVVIDGQTNTRCFNINHTNAVVDSFVIMRGATTNHGGGIYLTAGTLQYCTIFSNVSSSNGGGVYCPGGTGISNLLVVVSNCVISNNVGKNGGGIYVDEKKWNALFVDCPIFGNNANGYNSYDGGGGIAVNQSKITVRNCIIITNVALQNGGGIYVRADYYNDKLSVIDNCTLSSNLSVQRYGGGIYAYEGAGPGSIYTNCRIIGNSANSGGGGMFVGTRDLLVDSVICNNQITNKISAYGGGVYNKGIAKNCIVASNIADPAESYGAGMHCYNNSTSLNCLIAYNSGGRRGGGLSSLGGTIVNCTIVSNLGSSGGGYYGGLSGGSRECLVQNSIIYFNRYTSSGSNYFQPDGTTYYYNTCTSPQFTGVTTNLSTNNIFIDPVFVGRDAGDWHLAAQSPGINAGTNQEWMGNSKDLDGRWRINRFYGNIVDMGVYEYIPRLTSFSVY